MEADPASSTSVINHSGSHDDVSEAGREDQEADEDIFEVERILKKRRHPSKGDQYLVKWRNFPASENTWEPACNFSRILIEQFERKRKKRNTDNNNNASCKSFTSDRAKSSSSAKTIEEEIVYEPQLPEQTIIVTDVTSKDQTVTICESEKADGFFKSNTIKI